MRFGTFCAAGLAGLAVTACEMPKEPASAPKPSASASNELPANCPPMTMPVCPPAGEAAKAPAAKPTAAKPATTVQARAKPKVHRQRTAARQASGRRYERYRGEAETGLAGGGERYARYTEREYPRPTGDYYRQDRSSEYQRYAAPRAYQRYEGQSRYVAPPRVYQRYEGQSQYVPPPPPPPRYAPPPPRRYAYEYESQERETQSERRYEEYEEHRSGGGVAAGGPCGGCAPHGNAYSFERYGTYYTAGRDARGFLVWPGKRD